MASIRHVAVAVMAVFANTGGVVADDTVLLKEAQRVFQPLQEETLRTGSATPHLGGLLVLDPRVSIDGNVSCATCHQPALYGTDALRKSIGVRQRVQARNAPTVLNAALSFVNNWRGDRESVEHQVQRALTAP